MGGDASVAHRQHSCSERNVDWFGRVSKFGGRGTQVSWKLRGGFSFVEILAERFEHDTWCDAFGWLGRFVKKIRILVADSHELIRRGVRALLRPCNDLALVAVAMDGHEVFAKTRQLSPDVVVLDLSLPRRDGLEVVGAIGRLGLGTEFVVLTAHESDQMVRSALQAGAKGYVLKSDSGRDIISAIRAVARHRQYLSRKVSEIILASFVRSQEIRNRASPSESGLTFRQIEIVRLVAAGLGNKRIAEELGISVKTVETHRAAVARVLNIHTAEELVRYARRNRIVTGQSTRPSRV